MISFPFLVRTCVTVLLCISYVGCEQESSDDSLATPISNLTRELEENREEIDWDRDFSLKVILKKAREKKRFDLVNTRNPFQYDAKRTSPDSFGISSLKPDDEPIKQSDIESDPRNSSTVHAAELRLIGFVDLESESDRIAVFSDGRRVLQGRLNDVLAGQYLIREIGVSSVEIKVLSDGHTRSLTLEGV